MRTQNILRRFAGITLGTITLSSAIVYTGAFTPVNVFADDNVQIIEEDLTLTNQADSISTRSFDDFAEAYDNDILDGDENLKNNGLWQADEVEDEDMPLLKGNLFMNGSPGGKFIPEGRVDEKVRKEISDYLDNLDYDKDTILKVTDDGSSKVKTGRSTAGDSDHFYIVSNEEKSIEKGNMDIASMDASSNVVYPGALIQANDNVMAGKPDLVRVDRPSLNRYSITLPRTSGESINTFECSPYYADVNNSINDAIVKWYKDNKEQGVSAKIQYKAAIASSESQLKSELNVSYGDIAKLGIDFSNEAEQSTVVLSATQTYFSVINDNSNIINPGDAFGENETLEHIKQVCSADNPPLVINKVDYGRRIYIVIKSSSNTTALKAALEATMSGVDIGEKTEYKNIINNSDISILAYGGSTDDAGRLITLSAGGAKNYEELVKIIANGVNYDPTKTVAEPISYVANYLDSSQSFAVIQSNVKYIEKTTRDFYSTKVDFEHSSYAFIDKESYVKGNEFLGFDENGNIMVQEKYYYHKKGHFYTDYHAVIPASANIGANGQGVGLKVGLDIFWGSDWPLNEGKVVLKPTKKLNIQIYGACRNAHFEITTDYGKFVDYT